MLSEWIYVVLYVLCEQVCVYVCVSKQLAYDCYIDTQTRNRSWFLCERLCVQNNIDWLARICCVLFSLFEHFVVVHTHIVSESERNYYCYYYNLFWCIAVYWCFCCCCCVVFIGFEQLRSTYAITKTHKIFDFVHKVVSEKKYRVKHWVWTWTHMHQKL